MNILEKLDDQSLFTKNELEVVHYIKNKPYQIINLSIHDLAQNTYSSNASIIRICKKLGFKGYKEFKMKYAKQLESQKYINHDTDFTIPFGDDEPTWQIINNIGTVYKESIDLINSQLDINELETIVDVLDSSERVFVYAIGDSKITAMAFMNKLVKVGKFFILTTENHEEIHYSRSTNKNDCCLFISYDSSPTYTECLRILLRNKCKIITITANESSPLVKYSHHHISIPHKEKTEKIATFYSQLSFNYILSILYSLLYQRYKQK